MQKFRVKFVTHALLLATAAMIPSTAWAQSDSVFLGVTSGGQIAEPDRAVTDDLRDISTSAQISNENDTLIANFSFDMTINSKTRWDRKTGTLAVSTGSLSVKASLPINGAGKESFVDFRTFGNRGELTISYNHYSANFSEGSGEIQSDAAGARQCLVEVAPEWKANPNADQSRQIEAVLAAFDVAAAATPIIEERLKRSAKATEGNSDDFGTFAYNACRINGTKGITNPEQYSERFGPQDGFAGRNARRTKAGRGTVFWGGEVSLGYNRFLIADRTTVTLRVEDKLGFDINGRLGWLDGQSGRIVLFTAGYSRTYKPKELVDVCSAPDINGKTVCVNGQDGLPIRANTGYATLSLRQIMKRNAIGQPVVGVRPSVTYIFQDKDWQFELPIYLQRNAKGGLDAGVRVIYNTGRDKVGIGAFIGVPF